MRSNAADTLRHTRLFIAFAVVAPLAVAGGCGDDGGGSAAGAGGTGGVPEQTGRSCNAPTDCYPGVADGAALSGEVICLDRVENGYCTHLCESDDDCCAAPGECDTTLRQVCSPFESTGQKHCFLSCEKDDLAASDAAAGDAAADDGTAYCAREAHVDFICRSSGGGSANRKVCVPGGGSAIDAAAD